jgi:hypothetical protein
MAAQRGQTAPAMKRLVGLNPVMASLGKSGDSLLNSSRAADETLTGSGIK